MTPSTRPGQTCDLDLDEWALPFAKDNAIIGGWNLNAVLTLQTGTPFTVYSDFGGITRADQSSDPNNGPENVNQWFKTSVFKKAAGSQGTAERNSVRGPGTRTLDLSPFKTFKLAHAGAIELRVEGFNVLNTAQYNQPNNVVSDSNFGKITGTRLNSERQVQLAARYIF